MEVSNLSPIRTYCVHLSFTAVDISVGAVGDDLFILVTGGEKPHLGTCVMAVPRPSLTGDGRVSATSSVLNRTGHKDEAICHLLAEKAAISHNAVTVCTGGFHMDHITGDQIRELMQALKELKL
ncbi:MAG: hypothetical protein SOH48_06890 [Eubacteriales bacterium]|jgi:hypothetical protein